MDQDVPFGIDHGGMLGIELVVVVFGLQPLGHGGLLLVGELQFFGRDLVQGLFAFEEPLFPAREQAVEDQALIDAVGIALAQSVQRVVQDKIDRSFLVNNP